MLKKSLQKAWHSFWLPKEALLGQSKGQHVSHPKLNFIFFTEFGKRNNLTELLMILWVIVVEIKLPKFCLLFDVIEKYLVRHFSKHFSTISKW